MAPSGLSEAEAKKLFEEALKGPPGKLVYTPSKEQANQTKRFIVGSDQYADSSLKHRAHSLTLTTSISYYNCAVRHRRRRPQRRPC